MRVMITGGAGFVGSALARHFLTKQNPRWDVTIFDNLRRRGAEFNVGRLQSLGAAFVHGDVRNPADLDALDGTFDVLIEASAEPSVHAGVGGSPRYVIDTNLTGAANCLEFARQRCGLLIFLSTSRVYSIEPLTRIRLKELPTRLDVSEDVRDPRGLSHAGVSEQFPTDTPRSYYGASKLAAELLCQEYAEHGGLSVVINRCGVIAGPGQFGRTDQGVFTLWVARHHFQRPLTYTGFGGKGLQVRDLLHPDDLCDALDLQIAGILELSGQVFNLGGGRAGAVSLREYTDLCREATGRETPIDARLETATVDIPWYVTDHAKATQAFGFAPRRNPRKIATEIADWIGRNEAELATLIV